MAFALEGVNMAIAVAIIFIIACLVAMLCRGLGKATEVNPEFCANMGFWWTVLPVGMIAATGFFPPLNISHYAPYGVLFAVVPIVGTIMLRKADVQGADMFGRDDQGRLSFLGCRPDEITTTVMYSLLGFELANIFLWDELYRFAVA